ncbi:hypothetical protein HDE_05377 [Halotydeus destructor]|nr:hypothetical protein HDE_05377 [Halotydeus destructor]
MMLTTMVNGVTSGRFLRTVQKRSTGTQVDLIVDLGSGVGNVTKLIANQFKGSTVIGLDIADEMVKYATNKYPDMTFLVADSGSPWNQFKQLTGVVEHSVDLVISTYMMQYLCTEGQRMNLVNNVETC